MGWFGALVVIGFIIWFISKMGATGTGSSRPRKTSRDVSLEAQEIADGITTIQQFRSLERKLENAENRISDNAYHKLEVLQAAINLAGSKNYQWQFIPASIDLYTPKFVLEHAYKVYSPEQYEELKRTLPDNESDWYGIRGYDEKDEPEPHIKLLINFREIIESDIPRDEMIKKINTFASKNKAIWDEYYGDSEYGLTPGDQWFADALSSEGLPLAYELYKDGYTTPEKCLKIDPDEFLKRKGVGEKKVEQLKQFQQKIRSNTTSPTTG